MTQLTPRPVPGAVDNPVRDLPRPVVLDDLPLVILYPHSRCNCRCVMCDIWKAKGREELGVDEIAGYLDEWRTLGVQRVVLSGGEPLMHSEISELGALLRAAGIGVTLLSTGLLMKRHAKDIVQYCDDVVVSLDGPEAIHDQIRNVPGAYQKLGDGVAAVTSADPSVSVTGRCTVQRANHNYLVETVDAAKQLGLQRISFLAADVSSQAFNRPGGWEAPRVNEISLTRPEIRTLGDSIDALERGYSDAFRSGFIAESPAKLRQKLVDYFFGLLGDGALPPVSCNAPWVSTVIEADGTVRPCYFHDPIGNVRDAGSLHAVLNSESAKAWRADLRTDENPICRRCVCSLALRDGNGT